MFHVSYAFYCVTFLVSSHNKHFFLCIRFWRLCQKWFSDQCTDFSFKIPVDYWQPSFCCSRYFVSAESWSSGNDGLHCTRRHIMSSIVFMRKVLSGIEESRETRKTSSSQYLLAQRLWIFWYTVISVCRQFCITYIYNLVEYFKQNM